MYAVVLFLEDNSVEVVPRSWVTGTPERKLCVWPPYKGVGITKAVEQRAPPDITWDTYMVEILKETDNYQKARSKCRKAEKGLKDLSTTDDNAKRKTNPPKQHYEVEDPDTSTMKRKRGEPSCSEDSDVSDDDMAKKTKKKSKKALQLPSVPEVPKLPSLPADVPDICSPNSSKFGETRKSGHSSSSSSTRHAQIIRSCLVGTADDLGQVADGQHSSTLPILATPSRNSNKNGRQPQTSGMVVEVPRDPTDRDLQLFTMLEQLTRQVRQNTLLLKAMANRQQAPSVPGCEIQSFSLPMKTEADFTNIEKLLKEGDKREVLVTHLKSLGGITSREVIDRIMVAMFNDTLACQYNWAGRGTKIGLAKKQITQVIKDAAKASNIKEAESECAIRNWLRYASDRNGGRRRRHEKKREIEVTQARKQLVLETSDSDSD